MNNLEKLSDGAFWRFSLAVYGREGVEEACLRLQDDYGLDVNLVLFCLWAGSRGRRLDGEELAALEVVAAAWQQEVVAPLRRVRRWLKTQASITGTAAEALRQGVKARELEAEALEQQLLEAQLSSPAKDPSPEAAAGNLLSYLTAKSITIDNRLKYHFIKVLLKSFEGISEYNAEAFLAKETGKP